MGSINGSMMHHVCAEAWFRRASSCLACMVIAAAVCVVFFFIAMIRAAEVETRVIQRDAGLNLVILSAEADLLRYWSSGVTDATFPESYIDRVADQEVANRLIQRLVRRISIEGHDVLVTGIAPVRWARGGRKASTISIEVDPGVIILGSAVSGALGADEGEEVEIRGKMFMVHEVLGPTGSIEDATLYLNLSDLQQLLGEEGRISEIQALECRCGDEIEDPLAFLRSELEPLLPGTQVLRRDRIAEARQKQRALAERMLSIGVLAVIPLASIIIAALAAMNARDRRDETGVLRALGRSVTYVSLLLLSRWVLLGICGAALGMAAAVLLLVTVGPGVFQVAPQALVFPRDVIIPAIVATPCIAIVAGLAPVLLQTTLDPARILNKG